MPFRLPKKCRSYFADITGGRDGTKLDTLFDGFYLCALVGLAQGKLDTNADLEPGAFVDNYPSDYSESGDYIAGLLISAEAKRQGISPSDADALERLMTQIVESQSKTRLSAYGENLLNQYASRGIDVMIENLAGHTSLEEFFKDYFECFNSGAFLN